MASGSGAAPNDDADTSTWPHGRFYAWQLLLTLVWWVLVYLKMRFPLWKFSEGSVCTRPSWLPAPALRALLKFRVVSFLCSPLSMAIAALYPHELAARATCALCVSLYHLTESCSTNRHGEYPILYTAWAMVLPGQWAAAATTGVAVHFVLCTGYAKVYMGSSWGWIDYRTMTAYLDLYVDSKSMAPLSRRMNRFLASSKALTSLLGLSTIMMECLVVPALALAAPPAYRPAASWVMITLHIGIAFAMSFNVSIAFFTTLPCYFTAFSLEAPILSPAWCLACIIGLMPTGICILRGRTLVDDWPISPISLYMWSGPQAMRLGKLTMVEDTRIVLVSDRVLKSGLENKVVFLYSMFEALTAPEAMSGAVHDSTMRILGFTVLQGSDEVVRAAVKMLQEDDEKHVENYLRAMSAWMKRDKRMLDAVTGEVLTSAKLVRVSGINAKEQGGRVTKVIV